MLLSFSIGFGEISPNSSFPLLSIKREITLHSGYRAILSCFFLHLLNTLTPVQIPRYVLLLPVVVRARVKQFLPSSLLGRTHKQQKATTKKTQLFIRVWSSAAGALTRRWGSSCSTHFASTLPLHTPHCGSKLYDFPPRNSFRLFLWFGRLFLFALPANA